MLGLLAGNMLLPTRWNAKSFADRCGSRTCHALHARMLQHVISRKSVEWDHHTLNQLESCICKCQTAGYWMVARIRCSIHTAATS